LLVWNPGPRRARKAWKLKRHERWLNEDLYIDGTWGLKLHQLYRAMDFLEANKEAIEEAIFPWVAGLLNLNGEIIFYDTISLHFEIAEEDEGDKHDQVKERQGRQDALCGAAAARAQQERTR